MTGEIGERVARLEEKTDLMLEGVRSIRQDVDIIKTSLAEKRGASKSIGWLSHLIVGVGGVLATLLTIKH